MLFNDESIFESDEILYAFRATKKQFRTKMDFLGIMLPYLLYYKLDFYKTKTDILTFCRVSVLYLFPERTACFQLVLPFFNVVFRTEDVMLVKGF